MFILRQSGPRLPICRDGEHNGHLGRLYKYVMLSLITPLKVRVQKVRLSAPRRLDEGIYKLSAELI
jgi:hypothetical protein